MVVNITQLQQASPSVSGAFQLTYTDEDNVTKTSQDIDVHISAQDLRQLLQSDFQGKIFGCKICRDLENCT